MTDRLRLSNAMLLSLLVHGLALLLIQTIGLRRTVLPSFSPPIEVDLTALPLPVPRAVPAPPVPEPAPPAEPEPVLLPETQIVDVPDGGKEKEPDATRLLSDRSITVKEEQVRRGEDGSDPARQSEESPQATAAKASSAEPAARGAPEKPSAERAGGEQIASLPSLEQLLPRLGDIVAQAEPEPSQARAGEPTGRDFLGAGSGRTFLRQPGTRDFLPHIREGDITLLNTKAYEFAPFVRRVAKRVFEHLVIAINHAVDGSGVHPGRETARVEAIMTQAGEFVTARLLDRNGSNGLTLDRELLRAAQPDVFFDANPPHGAQGADGNIHFVLEIDLTVFGSRNRGGGGFYGYSGFAGVGLL